MMMIRKIRKKEKKISLLVMDFIRKKTKAYQVTTDDDDEYVSWGSDFDESCSDDGTDGLGNRTNGNCDNDDYDLNDDEGEDEDDDDDNEEDNRLNGKCESYTLNKQKDCRPSKHHHHHHHHHQLRDHLVNGTVDKIENNVIHGSTAITYDNTYEAISETPSTSSYGGSSDNSSNCFYEIPPERRRGSSASDKSSSGIGGMNGSTRSNSGDDRSDLSSLHFDGYSLDEKKRNSHDNDSDLNHHHHHNYRDSHNHNNNHHHHHQCHHHNNNNNAHDQHQLSVEVTTEYIMRELNRKKRILLNGCEASSETSSGQCSVPSPKPRIRPLVKPAIPPKPNIAQFNQSKPESPGNNRRKLRRKIVRPTGEPPPPPVPKSPPPISPASSKLSLTDRLAELTLDDLNEVLGVQLSSDPEDNGVGDDGDGALSSPTTTTDITYNNNNNDNSTTTRCLNEKQLQPINNHNLTANLNQNQENLTEKRGLINDKNSKSNYKISETNDNQSDTVNNNYDNQSSSLAEINDIVNGIMDHDDDEDFGDYETPLNFKDSIEQQVNHLNNLRSTSVSTMGNNKPPLSSSSLPPPPSATLNGNNCHHQCTGLPTTSGSTLSPSSSPLSPSGCNRKISRSLSVASGSFTTDLGFSECTGISPYPISPPPPFDDNFCCSCRKLMKSVGSTPNLNAIRSSSSSSRSELSLSQVTPTTPLSSKTSTRKQSTQQTTTATTFDNNNSYNSSSSNHHHHQINHNQQQQKQQQQKQQQQNQHSHSYSHSTSNLSLLTVDRPKLPRSKPDCGNTNSNSYNNNNKSCSYNNNNNNLTSNINNNNNNNNNTSTGISLKAEIAAKFAEKAAYARKIINSRPPFRPFETIYATGKSFGFSSSSSNNHTSKSSSSISSSSLNINSNNQNINRSGSISNLAQRPLPPLPDDVMPIEKYSWFHGLERDSAATVLENLGTDGSYLVRPSKRAGQSNPLTLSILNRGKVFHLNIRRRSDGLYCLGKEKDKERTFASVPALIRFHQKEPILLTTKGESAGITKLMVTPISSKLTINPSSSSQLTTAS